MKVLGITSMILSIVFIFVPFVGSYLTIVCALLAAFSAGPGLTFGTIAILFNLINITFLSPIWPRTGDKMFLIGIQIIAGIILTLFQIRLILKSNKTSR